MIARENKSGSYGIDYKFSDMINNFAKGGKSGDAEITTRSPSRSVITTMRTPTSSIRSTLQANFQQKAPPPPPPTPTTTTATATYPIPTTKSSYSVQSILPPAYNENLAEVGTTWQIL